MNISKSQLAERIAGLDSFRAFAFFLVFLYHAGYLEGGYIGVDLFFMLSGYLMTSSITGMLQVEGKKGIWKFFDKRIARLLPSILSISCLVVFLSFVFVPDADRPEILRTSLTTLVGGANYYLALSQDYFGVAAIFNPFTHMWSISAEIHFYIVLAIIGFIFSFSYYALAIVIGVCVLLNIYFDVDASQSYLFSHSRIVSFFAGFILFKLVSHYPSKLRYGTYIKFFLYVLILSTAFAKAPYFFSNIDWLFNSIVANILGFALLYLILESDSKTIQNFVFFQNSISKFWLYLGKISYSLYLVHFPVISYSFWIWGDVSIFGLLGTFLLTVIISSLNYRFVESSFVRWSNNKIIDL